MAKNKTTQTEVNVAEFIESYVDSDQKKQDSFELIKMMESWSGFEPRMWGPTIIGFGSYHYKYESGHEGDAPLIGFSPRKSQFSLYVYSKTETSDELLQRLGKYKMGKSCIYMKKLSDIELSVLEELCNETIRYLNENHECACRQ